MKTYFDLLIAIALIATIFPALILLQAIHWKRSQWLYRHRRIGYIVSTFLLFCAVVISYGSFIEPHFLVTTRATIDLPNIETPFTIALVADFQAGPYKHEKDINKIVDRILSLHPDIVVMAGDQVDNVPLASDETTNLLPLSRLVEAGIPTYAINGNHERGAGIARHSNGPEQHIADIADHAKAILSSMGIVYLTNELVTTTIQGNDIAIFGGDSYWAGKLDFDALKEKKDDIPTIALIHNPSAAWLAAKQDIDLILAGHTHGGQIRLPFIGPVGRVDTILPKAWYQGLVEVDSDTQMYVTSGAGETGVRARLFNPPEVVLLTIQ